MDVVGTREESMRLRAVLVQSTDSDAVPNMPKRGRDVCYSGAWSRTFPAGRSETNRWPGSIIPHPSMLTTRRQQSCPSPCARVGIDRRAVPYTKA